MRSHASGTGLTSFGHFPEIMVIILFQARQARTGAVSALNYGPDNTRPLILLNMVLILYRVCNGVYMMKFCMIDGNATVIRVHLTERGTLDR